MHDLSKNIDVMQYTGASVFSVGSFGRLHILYNTIRAMITPHGPQGKKNQLRTKQICSVQSWDRLNIHRGEGHE